MRCSHGARVVRPTVESVPFAFEGERIRQSQKEERPTRSRTSVRPRPSESELLVPLTPRRIQSEGEIEREKDRLTNCPLEEPQTSKQNSVTEAMLLSNQQRSLQDIRETMEIARRTGEQRRLLTRQTEGGGREDLPCQLNDD